MFKSLFRKLFKNDQSKITIQNSESGSDIDIHDKLALFDIIGFVGVIKFFHDNQYCVVYKSIQSENDNYRKQGQIALIEGDAILYTKKLIRPFNPYVAKNGTLICVDWLVPNSTKSKFYVIDKDGKIIFEKEMHSYIQSHIISSDGKVCLIETTGKNEPDSNKLFLIGISENIVTSINKPKVEIDKIKLDSQNRMINLFNSKDIPLKISFDGQVQNENEYQQKTLVLLNPVEKYFFLSRQPIEELMDNNDYIKAMLDIEADAKYHNDMNMAKLYRNIGDYFENKSELNKTIFYWEKAILINPKIGLKVKLKKLKINTDSQEL